MLESVWRAKFGASEVVFGYCLLVFVLPHRHWLDVHPAIAPDTKSPAVSLMLSDPPIRPLGPGLRQKCAVRA